MSKALGEREKADAESNETGGPEQRRGGRANKVHKSDNAESRGRVNTITTKAATSNRKGVGSKTVQRAQARERSNSGHTQAHERRERAREKSKRHPRASERGRQGALQESKREIAKQVCEQKRGATQELQTKEQERDQDVKQ